MMRKAAVVGKRFMNGTAVSFTATGSPKTVLKREALGAVAKPMAGEVGLKFLAAPISAVDLAAVQGVYGSATGVGGNHGVAVVTDVGSGVTGFAAGDWVVPVRAGFGTWRTTAAAKAGDVVKVANDIPAPYAATLAQDPATAYRLLRDFVGLKAGDVVVQNGANSAVGLAVVQLAKEMGVKTVNVIRSDQPDAETMARLVSNLGGDVVVSDLHVNTSVFREILADLPPCRLALNNMGGEVAAEMLRSLAVGGTLVTYGGAAKEPSAFPMDLLAYKNLSLKGFWLPAWYDAHDVGAANAMLNELAGLVRAKKLTLFYEMHDFDDFDHALRRAEEPFNSREIVLNIDFPADRFKEHDAKSDKEYEIFETSVL